jgi:hypothetical protein
MSQPDVGDVHVNTLLTQLSIAHMNQPGAYIADRVFPLVGVNKQSDIYPVYSRGFFFQDPGQDMLRAPRARAKVAGYEVDTSNTYFAVCYAIGAEIGDELRANADDVFDLDRDATALVTEIQRIRRERGFASDFMTTGVWGTDKVGATDFTKWSDYGASDPFTDLEDGLDTVEQNTGFRPNKLVMGAIVWRRLKHHPDFIDRVKGAAGPGNPAVVTRQLLASLLEIDEVLVSRAVYNSANEGQTASLSRIVDDDALLLYTPANPGLLVPSAGYTFYWRPLTGGAIQYIRKGREERERYDWIEAHSYWDQVATETEAGYFFSDAVD